MHTSLSSSSSSNFDRRAIGGGEESDELSSSESSSGLRKYLRVSITLCKNHTIRDASQQMSSRDQVGAADLFVGWLAACLQLQVERVKEEKLSGFAAALFVYDDTVRPILSNVRPTIFCGKRMVVVCDRITVYFLH